MAGATATATEDQEGRSPPTNREREIGQSEPSPMMTPEPPSHPESYVPPSTKGRAETPPDTGDRVVAGWTDAMEEALNSSSVNAEHRALMGVVLQSIRSVNHGLKETFGGLLTGFEVSDVIYFPLK
jgi:hypothetical protein